MEKHSPPPVKIETNLSLPPDPPSILPPDWSPIDLASSLPLGGVENPEILIARQRE